MKNGFSFTAEQALAADLKTLHTSLGYIRTPEMRQMGKSQADIGLIPTNEQVEPKWDACM